MVFKIVDSCLTTILSHRSLFTQHEAVSFHLRRPCLGGLAESPPLSPRGGNGAALLSPLSHVCCCFQRPRQGLFLSTVVYRAL